MFAINSIVETPKGQGEIVGSTSNGWHTVKIGSDNLKFRTSQLKIVEKIEKEEKVKKAVEKIEEKIEKIEGEKIKYAIAHVLCEVNPSKKLTIVTLMFLVDKISEILKKIRSEKDVKKYIKGEVYIHAHTEGNRKMNNTEEEIFGLEDRYVSGVVEYLVAEILDSTIMKMRTNQIKIEITDVVFAIKNDEELSPLF